jgi:hypothetical protein
MKAARALPMAVLNFCFSHDMPRKPKRKRGIRIRLDGATVRFELRRSGLSVRHGRRRPEKIVGFQDLSDLATGQIKMNLV